MSCGRQSSLGNEAHKGSLIQVSPEVLAWTNSPGLSPKVPGCPPKSRVVLKSPGLSSKVPGCPQSPGLSPKVPGCPPKLWIVQKVPGCPKISDRKSWVVPKSPGLSQKSRVVQKVTSCSHKSNETLGLRPWMSTIDYMKIYTVCHSHIVAVHAIRIF